MKKLVITCLAGLFVKTVVGDTLTPPGFGSLDSLVVGAGKDLIAKSLLKGAKDELTDAKDKLKGAKDELTDAGKDLLGAGKDLLAENRNLASDLTKNEVQSGGKKGGDKMKPTFVDIPDQIKNETINKAPENLRGGSSSGNESGDGDEKKDPVLESIEGAEKKLVEALGAVKTRLVTHGKGHKPIKVDCGTTRVRVVCNKKGQPESVDELPEEKAEKALTTEVPEPEEPVEGEVTDVKESQEAELPEA
ncbi:uncharacterized protein TA03475 [Theileria annulata]|uniref:Uncharacterized protein n=1 Tax=Theileria annulata TaxID=5874 RepID=Q4UCK2_THEAN|nr:uncharacterized protein TA03475 [Theileria annulata]CAI75449.1 hypothetical protein TA03475 [Theileria annulata]|eukprot:XP_954925.1 hypothetical protein TA03475 [Theileria annulata]